MVQYLRPGSPPILVDYYRLVDEDSLIIGTTTGTCSESRVTGVAETDDSVTITVQLFTVVFHPCAGVAYPIEFPVELEQPLGDRLVFDPHHEVPRSR